MKSYRITICLMTILMAGCAVASHNQTFVIEKARSINRYPVSRSSFVDELGLSKIKSERVHFRLRANRYSLEETWKHPSGLTIRAIDWKESPNDPFTTQISGITFEGLPGMPPQAQPSQSFNQVIITTTSGRELFRSVWSKPGNVEQGAAPPTAGATHSK